MVNDELFQNWLIEHDERMVLQLRLDRIAAAAREELKRIEKHGGCTGFATRVLALATEGGDDG